MIVFFSIIESISLNSILSLIDKSFPIEDLPTPIIPVNTRFFFNLYQNFNLIYHKFVLISEFKYILKTMQPRLNLRSKNNSSLFGIAIKGLVIIVFISLAFYLVDKIDFPSPQSETKEDVTNQIIKLK